MKISPFSLRFLFLVAPFLLAGEVPVLKGIVLMDDPKDFLKNESLSEIEGLVCLDFTLPGDETILAERLSPFIGTPVTEESVASIEKEIYEYYKEMDHPFVVALSPKKTRKNPQVVQFVLSEAKIGKIEVDETKWTQCKWLLNYMELKPGDRINEKKIRRDLDFMNRNPFRRVDLFYIKGRDTLECDIKLVTEERRPYRPFFGVDNTGVPTIGRQRLFTGITWANAFFADHIFTYQFSTSYRVSEFQAHMVQYMALLPWRHALNLYGGISFLKANLAFPGMKNHGLSGQASGRYIIPLGLTKNINQELIFGFDFKRTQNNVLFSELYPAFGQIVNLSQFVFDYSGRLNVENHRLLFGMQLFWSPGAMMSDETNGDYNSLRPGAVNHWVYGRPYVDYELNFRKGFVFSLSARGQFSTQNLLPSEQLGIGGYGSVRGYDERQLNYDNGAIVSTELRVFPLPILNYFSKSEIQDALQFLAFADFGWGTNFRKIPNEPYSDYLLSAGPGLRYTIDPAISFRLDWGIKLHRQMIFTGGSSMIHFNGTLSY